MKQEMLINVAQAEECRIAIVEDGLLEELYLERTSQSNFVGNIYKGRIVNLGSVQSFLHVRTPSSTAYTASKHGVLGFTKALAAELGKDGVRVNAIGPGFIETPLNEKVRAERPELVKIFIDHTPLGRAGQPEDIVGPAIFLASDLSAYVTGSIVMADGGYRTV